MVPARFGEEGAGVDSQVAEAERHAKCTAPRAALTPFAGNQNHTEGKRAFRSMVGLSFLTEQRAGTTAIIFGVWRSFRPAYFTC